MESVFTFISYAFTNIYGISALGILGLGIYWLFDKKAKKKGLAELRAKLDELSPTDPEYNQVRALYTSMMINEQLYSSSTDNNNSLSGGDGSDSNVNDSDSD